MLMMLQHTTVATFLSKDHQTLETLCIFLCVVLVLDSPVKKSM